MREGADKVTKRAENFENCRVLTKFGYSRQCTKSIQNFENSRVVTNFGYSRQCTKSIQNFLYLRVSDCQKPNLDIMTPLQSTDHMKSTEEDQ